MTFVQPFMLDGFDGTLPPGTYELESEQEILEGVSLPDCLRTSVTLHLHSQVGSPTLAQTLTVPWEALDRAQRRDHEPAELPSDVLLARMLADPLVQLLMLSDGVSETEVGRVVRAARAPNPHQSSCVDPDEHARLPSQSSLLPSSRITGCDRKIADWRSTNRAENEGMALVPA